MEGPAAVNNPDRSGAVDTASDRAPAPGGAAAPAGTEVSGGAEIPGGAAPAAAAAAAGAATAPAGTRHLPDLLYSEGKAICGRRSGHCSKIAADGRRCSREPRAVRPYDAGLWRALAAELGCAGLLIPAEHGGAGASYREACVTAEELGRYVAPVPFLGSAVVATAALLAAGDTELLAKLATGGVTAALAVPFAAMPGAPVAAHGPARAGRSRGTPIPVWPG